MVKIKSVDAKAIEDSRGDKTIFVTIKTDKGKKFSSSAPNGKSRGRNEVKIYKKSLEEDIKNLRKVGDYLSEEILEVFDDLRHVEDVVRENVGGNTILALEYAVLKAIADEQNKPIWNILNSSFLNLQAEKMKFPRLVGNCIGGGEHSKDLEGLKPDFQEFLLIPKSNSPEKAYNQNKKNKDNVKDFLIKTDKNFKKQQNDENAWQVSLNQKQILDLLKKTKTPLGVDIAASSFYKRKKYNYRNPLIKRTPEEQLVYLENLIKNTGLFYIEDPFQEEDFESHSKLLERFPGSLVVGDDLTVTNPKRLKKAIKNKSINALIVKPNQCGSLLTVREVCEIAQEAGIKTVFSHRSGETDEDILADIAFGFQGDFLKSGITGKERERKLLRLIDIEKSIKE
ncbi:MAG TPA: enolase C-terminal domain-like protein [Candidatus Nanoarchaeia archaeon]|nr:enolase C-terminal domain-like protein [Candidatus Nanoarchaeia archaeon]